MKIWGKVTFESRKDELEPQMHLPFTTLNFSFGKQGQGDIKQCRNHTWLLETSQSTRLEIFLL